MNLHAIAAPLVAAVNPFVPGKYLASNGLTVNADGSQTPGYAAPVSVKIQKQALTYRDLQQLDGINLNGEKAAMYISGDWQGVSRPRSKGGDKVTLDGDGSVWLVAQVLENWYNPDGWTKVAVTLQNGS